jgi:hypothetical protein
MQVIVKPKVFCSSKPSSQKSIFRASFFKWRQNLLLYHMYRLMAVMRTKSTRALSFSSIFGSSYFVGQNDQLRLKSLQAALKAFQMIFP